MWTTWGKLFLLVVFHGLVALCLTTYARITRSDPGYVDPNWVRLFFFYLMHASLIFLSLLFIYLHAKADVAA